MVTASLDTACEIIDCREDEGEFRNNVRASNRKLAWENICSELIDNALEHSDGKCCIVFEWRRTRSGDVFRAADNGLGSVDLQAFFKPGKSVQTGRSSGNSTFGMGLFVCECCLSSPEHQGKLQVATSTGGSHILTAFRHIERSMKIEKIAVLATDDSRREYGIGYRGTSITFSRCSKAKPTAKQLKSITEKLSRWYATAIAAELLEITLRVDGEERVVPPEPIPSCDELKSVVLTIDGHQFSVEWGLTTGVCKDSGCRLIYGGKFFETSSGPCGDYRLGHFYGAIRIPRTIGKESMDILKRTIDHPVLDSLFSQCEELFRPELEKSDAICRQSEDHEQTSSIAMMLSSAVIPPRENADADGGDKGGAGDEDLRDYNGRDNSRRGVQPSDSGRTRHGRRSRRKRNGIPDSVAIFWAELGDDQAMVLYQHDGCRVTFNLDVPAVIHLRDTKQNAVLSAIAAGHIAKDIAGTHKQKDLGFGDLDFAFIYRKMIERSIALAESGSR